MRKAKQNPYCFITEGKPYYFIDLANGCIRWSNGYQHTLIHIRRLKLGNVFTNIIKARMATQEIVLNLQSTTYHIF